MSFNTIQPVNKQLDNCSINESDKDNQLNNCDEVGDNLIQHNMSDEHISTGSMNVKQKVTIQIPDKKPVPAKPVSAYSKMITKNLENLGIITPKKDEDERENLRNLKVRSKKSIDHKATMGCHLITVNDYAKKFLKEQKTEDQEQKDSTNNQWIIDREGVMTNHFQQHEGEMDLFYLVQQQIGLMSTKTPLIPMKHIPYMCGDSRDIFFAASILKSTLGPDDKEVLLADKLPHCKLGITYMELCLLCIRSSNYQMSLALEKLKKCLETRTIVSSKNGLSPSRWKEVFDSGFIKINNGLTYDCRALVYIDCRVQVEIENSLCWVKLISFIMDVIMLRKCFFSKLVDFQGIVIIYNNMKADHKNVWVRSTIPPAFLKAIVKYECILPYPIKIMLIEPDKKSSLMYANYIGYTIKDLIYVVYSKAIGRLKTHKKSVSADIIKALKYLIHEKSNHEDFGGKLISYYKPPSQ